MTNQHVVVIGAGSTGAAVAHDLALRGLRVILIERFGAARECIEENFILLKLIAL